MVFLSSTLASNNTKRGTLAQFGNSCNSCNKEADASLSTIGFPSIQDSKDSNNSRPKETEKPETMAFNPNAFQSLPGAADEDAMSEMSSASVASTIFDGATDQRLTTVRELQQEISKCVRRFMHKHDEALKDDDDIDGVQMADDFRLECVNKAWKFIEEAMKEFCTHSDFDVQARSRIAFFIDGHQKKFATRPVIHPGMRGVVGYDRPFPKYEDVVAAHATRDKPSVFSGPYDVTAPGAHAAPPTSAQKKRNVSDESLHPQPLGKRGRSGSNPEEVVVPDVNVIEVGELPVQTGNPLPPGARSKETSKWLQDQQQERREARSRSPTDAIRRKELEDLRKQTDQINKEKEANKKEIEKLRQMKAEMEKQMAETQRLREIERKQRAEEKKKRKEKKGEEKRKMEEEEKRKEEEKRANRLHQVAKERSEEFQRKAIADAAKSAAELQQMQEILASMAIESNAAAEGLADAMAMTDDDSDDDFILVQSKKNKKKTPSKSPRQPATPSVHFAIPSPPPLRNAKPVPAARRNIAFDAARFAGNGAAAPLGAGSDAMTSSYARDYIAAPSQLGNAAPASVRIHGGGMEQELAWLHTQQLAQTFAQNARPAVPFEMGSANQYLIHMARFDMVANTRGMDSRAKVLELSNWFTGTPQVIIDAVSTIEDADLAYATARSELDALFGRNRDSASSLIQFVNEGKPLHPHDYKGHLSLYGQLRATQATATASGKQRELDTEDVLQAVLGRKLPHMEEKFWHKEEKQKAKGLPSLTFQNLLERLQIYINVLTSMKKTPATQTAKVAATNVVNAKPEVRRSAHEAPNHESYARSVTKSPPLPQPTERCIVCEGYHATVACATLAKLDADSKRKRLMDKRACLSCFQPNSHIAKNCPTPAKCIICHRSHHTILHGCTYPQAAPRLSATATSFEPASSGAASTTNTSSTTTSRGVRVPSQAQAAAATAPTEAPEAPPAAPPAAPQTAAGNPVI